jgi:hypothetical protein
VKARNALLEQLLSERSGDRHPDLLDLRGVVTGAP